MKRVIGWLIVGVVLSGGTAYAQEVEEVNKVPGCVRPINPRSPSTTYSVAQWNNSSATHQKAVCSLEQTLRESDALTKTVEAQFAKADPFHVDKTKTTRDYNSRVKYTGWVMIIVGAAAMIPAGKTYTVLGDDYCVTDYEVYSGGCSTPRTVMKILGVVVATGVVMAVVGGRQVAIKGSITPTEKSFGATIRWGGKNGRKQ